METHGLDDDGNIFETRNHRHEVELDLVRFELGISRTLSASHDLALRVPYLIRDQHASIGFDGGASSGERDAAQKNADIHHRTETYEGFADPELTMGWRATEIPLLGKRSVLRVSFGSSIPVGETEEDPWLLGDGGREHLHIQFGNGTFDPLLDVYVGAPINATLAWSIYGKSRLPLFRNDEGYRGAPELSVSPRLTWLPIRTMSVSGGVNALYFGYSDWEETGRDRNSGQYSFLASASLGYKVTDNMTASVNALLPIYTDSFSSEDTLDLAPTFSLSLGYSF